ncbi:HD domain-containing protein [Flavobacterium sp. xlx-214]|uniref:Pycsar system effector family protein n=1 Tax=unclassified Flavobacterium TaxID=196869 RepID=UPI0013D6E7F0|nr:MULTISPECIES: Pycsar system effector family protein [unclassified Flavobacterium]MBA5791850.1 HD domain-containing protein [Flavobacterium sp. xlx-221]QMI83087.1 HD domain-containing protein [Flavobacterium sp. xlx-214]
MELLIKAEAYVFNLFKDKLSAEYIYHDFLHTLRVVTALKELIKGEGIEEQNSIELLLAGWFHDTGYIYGNENHEEKSCTIFKEFINNESNFSINIENVCAIILATKFGKEPTNILEMCMKDADFYHFTLDNYQEHCMVLKKEIEFIQNKEISDEEWCAGNIKMFTKIQHYYTNYAKTFWQPKKEKNLFKIYDQNVKEKLGKKSTNKELKEKKLEKLDRPERGIDTLFRVTLNNHTQLSAIADSKANILLSVNSIIISITLTAIIPKLDSPSNAHLIIPTFVLLIFSVITIVFTIMATKPKVSSNPNIKSDIQSRKANILFFGNFHQLELNDFNTAMNDLMKDRDYLYDTLIKDLYYLGLVLNRKYKLLSISYTVFMIGIILSVSAFCLAFIKL